MGLMVDPVTWNGSADWIALRLLSTLPFVLMVVAGVLLFRLTPVGRKLSIIVQAIQIPVLGWRGFHYQLFAGPHVTLLFMPDGSRQWRTAAGLGLNVLFGDWARGFYYPWGWNWLALAFMIYLLASANVVSARRGRRAA
jgi:hypothetical protein